MNLIEIESKSALHQLKRRGLPYKYDLNIYRGCSNGCKYCYATSSHKYLGNKDFEKDIYIKKNIAQVLDQELSAKGWHKDIINIGGVCDSYQEIEKETELMRDVLKVMIKHKNPVIISTKSDLILRDMDLIDTLAKDTYVNIAFSITSKDKKLASKLEKGASTPESRFKALSQVAKTNANTGFHFMPILPFVADDDETLEQLVMWAATADVDYMLSGMLYLTGGIKKRYFSFLKKEYPQFLDAYKKLYPQGGANKDYKSKIHNLLGKIRKKYDVNNSYSKFLPKN
jgi:DNA repair photolyase